MLSRPLPLKQYQAIGTQLDNVVVGTLMTWAKYVSRRPITLEFYRDDFGTLRCDVMATNKLRPSDFSPLASTEVSR